MKRKVFLIILSIIIILGIVKITFAASTRKEGIDAFPDSYKPYLQELAKKYPNWKFTALYTNLDWKYVIDKENKFGVNLVPKSYSKEWKNTKPGEYNVEVDAGWVDASRKAVEYAMDPRNFLNEVRCFQFEGLSYDAKTNTKDGIEKVLYGTEFYNKTVQYLNSSGSTITMNKKYSDLILSAAQTSKVSTYHLASRIKQEVGPFLSHSSISGKVKGYEGLYNFYNIGATSSSEPMGAIKNGLQYAKDGKGASSETKTKYLIPWNNKEKAITGGGIFIGSSYIHLGQDTIYLQKFHVSSNNGGTLFWHQYMTNVLAPYSEGKLIYNGYKNTNILNSSMSFIIPVYNNMPEIPQASPNILDSDFTKDNTKVYADVDNTLNIRTGPSTSYETLTSVDKNVIMTRIAKGRQSGELWDKVKLPNGMIGYAFQSYLKKVPEKQIEKIDLKLDNTTLKKGETKKLQITISPTEAKEHPVIYSSSNTKVATVNSSGNITAIGAGNSTITVKAKENNVSNSIKINVISPVTGIELDVDSIMLQEGENYTLVPIITPEDATNRNITYKAEKENIINIDNNGKITALNSGTTNVIIGVQGESITEKVGVTVVKGLAEGEIEFDKSLRLNANQVSGFNIKELQVQNIKEKIKTDYVVEIYSKEGKILQDSDMVGTGTIIRIIDQIGNIKMEYKIVIYGDVNGDGKINSVDSLVLQRHILEIQKLKGPYWTAGNTKKDGQKPSSIDALIIQRHILEIKFIEQ